MFVAMQASEVSLWQISPRSPHGLPSLCLVSSSSPHTCLIIVGVMAFTPRSSIEKRARIRANAFLSAGSLRGNVVVRLEMDTKSSSNMLTNKLLLHLVPCVFPGRRPGKGEVFIC